MAPFRHTPGPGRITPAEAFTRSRYGDAIMLDVRDEAEFAAGHAPDAVPMPLKHLTAGATLPAGASLRPVVCICKSGGRSSQAAEMLAQRGLKAFEVVGGMEAWAQSGLPVRTSGDLSGRIV